MDAEDRQVRYMDPLRKTPRRQVTAMLLLGLLASACTEPAEEPRDRTRTGRVGQYATDSSRWGEVMIEADSVLAAGVSGEDRRALLSMIERQHQSWLAQDSGALRDLMAADAMRVHTRSGFSDSADAIVAALPVEWEPHERPYGTIAQSFEILDVQLAIQGDIATATYWIDVHGGARWEFNGQRVSFDVYRRAAPTWELLFHTDAEARRSGAGAESGLPHMEFVYPAEDLERVAAFYQPLLGEPDGRSSERVSYDLGNARFHFDTTALAGVAEATDGTPNGYAEFVVPDLDGEALRLQSVGIAVDRIDATVERPAAALVQDPAGNVLLLREQAQAEDAVGAPSLTVAPDPGSSHEIQQTIEGYWNAWLMMDTETLVDQLSSDSRLVVETDARGTIAYESNEEIRQALPAIWSTYDRGPAGLALDVTIGSPTVRHLAELALLSYEYRMSGIDSPRNHESGVVTHLLEKGRSGWKIGWSLFTMLDDSDNLVLSLDYTGYPVGPLRRPERFYTDILRLGSPDQDVGYRGWWTRNSVFGIYRVGSSSPELLRPRRTNGYASFWVESVDEVYEYLQRSGSTFPVIRAINDRAGVDRQPGYIQLVSTDSEGNIVLFSEYPGT